jgi:U3 small nucleolar RNA-associated protein 25
VEELEKDEDEQSGPLNRPYMDLMRSLAESAPPQAKRRKLDHPASEMETQEIEVSGPSDSDFESEDGEEVESGDGSEEDPDMAEQSEDDADDAIPENLFDDDDEVDATDPFEAHFAASEEKEVESKVKSIERGSWQTKRSLVRSSRVVLQAPESKDGTEPALPGALSGPATLKLKKKLSEVVMTKHPRFATHEQLLAPFIFNYQDTLYCERTVSQADSLRRLAALHSLNHIFK